MAADRGDHEASTRLRSERDLYRKLLDLGAERDLAGLVEQALALVVDVTGAERGFLEFEDTGNGGSDARWCRAIGFDATEIEPIRGAISRGIIAEALASGQTVSTASAQLDPRFSDRESVRHGHIEAVLCANVGDAPPIGIVYLQGREKPGPFSEEDRCRVEAFARHLAPFVDRLLAQERDRRGTDPTAEVRRQLRLEGVVGRTRALAHALQQAALAAPLEVNVLLTGESGTGKTQLARLIHANSPRAAGPFVELSCATLPAELVESELFGARAGAHSTATHSVPGKVAAAEAGTLFLDEIGELPVAAQAKLLQLLHSKEYYPLGAARSVCADVRLIAATNMDLSVAVRERRFREDLFYRLQVLPIRLPSLAERREDIPELGRFFCASACERHGLGPLELSTASIRMMEAAEWPGNVRQLAHTIEAAAIRAAGEGCGRIQRRHVFPESLLSDEEPQVSFQEATRRFQRELLVRTLRDTGWKITETAHRLDLARSHVYNLIHAFGLARDSSKPE
jgi:Nif-specific regulatory protein